MNFSDISRNEDVARQELTQQAKTLTLLRPLADLLNMRLKGESETLSGCDILAATMWLFDNMLYFETRPECPGTRRQEAESLLVAHFTEAHPDWDEPKRIRIAQALFSSLTPRAGYKKLYYDFCQHQHREYFFRLIEWNATASSEVLYKLTPESMILYATRLEEGGLEYATVSAMRAERTLRRGEIDLAIQAATRTVAELKNFQLRINAGLRAARMGDTSFTFFETMRPLLHDSYDLLDEIFNRVTRTLDRIHELRQDCTPDKRKKLHEAEDIFHRVKIECREFKDNISTVHEQFEHYRLEIVGLREVFLNNHDLTSSVLKPLLALPMVNIADKVDTLVALMLPPALIPKSKRKTPYHFDLCTILNACYDSLDRGDTFGEGYTEGEVQPYTSPPPCLNDETISFANYWVNNHLQRHGQVYFSDVIIEYKAGNLTYEQQIACLLSVGAQATSDKAAFEVNIDGSINSGDILGDNLGVQRINHQLISG